MAILKIPCKSFTFKLANGKSVTGNYNKVFDWDGKDVLYILICNNCDYFYLGKTIAFKQKIQKDKSDVKHPQNISCRECAKIEPAQKLNIFLRFIRFIMKRTITLETTKENDFLLNGGHR